MKSILRRRNFLSVGRIHREYEPNQDSKDLFYFTDSEGVQYQIASPYLKNELKEMHDQPVIVSGVTETNSHRTFLKLHKISSLFKDDDLSEVDKPLVRSA